MLKLYNKEHEAISALTNLKDYKIEYVLSGEDLTEFSLSICDENIHLVEEEGYVRNKNNEYVIKAIDPTDNFKRYSCIVNIEDIRGKSIANFDTSNNNITETIRLAIAGTGWVLADNNISKRRTVRLKNTNALEVLREVRKVFRVDFRFDAINKIIYAYEQFGEDKGVYFSDELNLKSFSIPSDTYDYATRLYCYGKDGLNISSINNGKEYIENFQYSNKIIELIWEDNRYTNVNSLKEDAEAKLDELSKPKRSYQADIVDLAKQSAEYKFLDFFLGDTITLLSKQEKFRDKQRIVKYIEYPKSPTQNTCELGNTTLTFEELQKENEAKNSTVDNITSDNGTVDGSKVDDIKSKQISDLEVEVAKITNLTVINADIVNLKAQNVTITGKLNVIEGEFGTLKSNVATIDKLTVTHTATINELKANKADITQLNAVSANIGTVEAQVGKIQTLVNGNLSSENIQAGGITSDKLTIANGFITNAMISNLDVSKINAGDISTNKFRIKSDDGGIEIVGATQQFKDKNNKVRVQIGRDKNNNFTFSLFDETGAGVLIDHTGIKEGAIADDLIISDMIASDAVGEKQINYSSFITGFNKDTNTSTIKSTKIMLNNQNQTLEVAFNSLKTQADGTKSLTESHSTTIGVMQGQITTAINNTQIVKDGQTILLKDDYNRTVQTVNSMNSTIGSHTTKINEHTGKITGVETRVNTVERDLEGITQRVSSTETTVSNHTTNIAKAQAQADKGVSDAKGALDKANVVDGRVTTLNTTVTATNSKVSVIEQNLNSITQRVSSTEKNVTTVTNTANTANSNATSALNTANSANSKIDGLEIGCNNLLFDTRELGDRWRGGTVNDNYIFDGCKYRLLERQNYEGTSRTFIYSRFLEKIDLLKKGTNIALSCWLYIDSSKEFTSSTSNNMFIRVNFKNTEGVITSKDFRKSFNDIVRDRWVHFTYSFVLDVDVLNGEDNSWYIALARNGSVRIAKPKMEIGTKATDWSPAPEDVQTQIDTNKTEISSTKSKVSTIETNLTGITSRVETVENTTTTINGKVTALETWKKSAEVKISDSAIVSTVTKSTAYKNDLNGKVSYNNIISSINQTAEAIKIDASKINLNGYVTMTNLNTPGQTVIDGENIKTNTILAEKIAIGDFTNYVVLPTNSTFTGTSGSTEGYEISSIAGSEKYNNANISNKLYGINGGDKFRVKAMIKCYTAGSRLDITCCWRNANNEIVSSSTVYKAVSSANTWTEINEIITVPSRPSGASYVRFKINIQAEQYRRFYVERLNITRMYNGELIVDGSITATKLSADAIDGKLIKGVTVVGGEIRGSSNFFTAPNSSATDGYNFRIYSTGELYSGGLVNISDVNNPSSKFCSIYPSGYIHASDYINPGNGVKTSGQSLWLGIRDIALGSASNFNIELTQQSDKNVYLRPGYNGQAILGHPSYMWNKVYAVNGVSSSSDRTLKENIQYLATTENTLTTKSADLTESDLYNFVKDDLITATYNFIDDEKTHIGFIAQDLLYNIDGSDNKIGQLLINKPDGEQSPLSYNEKIYSNILAGALRHAILKIEELEIKIKVLESN